ncbi:MAG: DUF952 domain-containing protein [Actinomycetota bacterium]
MTTEPIFHVALRPDWEAAQREGRYRVSTRGRTLEEVGFIHASYRHQVLPTGRAFYADVADEVVVLQIDSDRLGCEVRLEDGGGELFPHIYGPIPVAAVCGQLTATRAHGTFEVPGLE